VLVAGAGLMAGAVNAVVGGGTLVTFPTLLALGVPAITANVSNNLGLVVGNITGTWALRDGLTGQRHRVLRLLPVSAVCGVGGAVLLLTLPAQTFRRVVPALILLAVVLVVLQPVLTRRLAARQVPAEQPLAAQVGVGLAGLYGGYFGAAQGVMLLAALGLTAAEPLPRLNALKNLLTLAVNVLAGVVFVVVRPSAVDPVVVLAVAAGSWAGGLLGARFARRLSPSGLRVTVAVVGVAAVARLLATS
jgi:uncharacterized membrane protein YfcA